MTTIPDSLHSRMQAILSTDAPYNMVSEFTKPLWPDLLFVRRIGSKCGGCHSVLSCMDRVGTEWIESCHMVGSTVFWMHLQCFC